MSTEARGEACGGGQKGQDPFSNLHGLLKEIQVLRDQAERSIQTNNTLKSKLEKQLSQGSKQAQEGALTLAVQALSVTEWSLQLDKHGREPASFCCVAVQLYGSIFCVPSVLIPTQCIVSD